MVERKGIAAALVAALAAASTPAGADPDGIDLVDVAEGVREPRISVTVSGTSAITALVSASETWGFSFGGSLGVTKTGPGLGGLLQVGYLCPSSHWSHAIPVDIGGQYKWGSLRRSIFLSGGMSFVVFLPRGGMTPRGMLDLGDEWQVVPLVYVDVGGRVMIRPHLGLDFKVETRTYWAINILAAKISLVF